MTSLPCATYQASSYALLQARGIDQDQESPFARASTWPLTVRLIHDPAHLSNEVAMNDQNERSLPTGENLRDRLSRVLGEALSLLDDDDLFDDDDACENSFYECDHGSRLSDASVVSQEGADDDDDDEEEDYGSFASPLAIAKASKKLNVRKQ